MAELSLHLFFLLGEDNADLKVLFDRTLEAELDKSSVHELRALIRDVLACLDGHLQLVRPSGHRSLPYSNLVDTLEELTSALPKWIGSGDHKAAVELMQDDQMGARDRVYDQFWPVQAVYRFRTTLREFVQRRSRNALPAFDAGHAVGRLQADLSYCPELNPPETPMVTLKLDDFVPASEADPRMSRPQCHPPEEHLAELQKFVKDRLGIELPPPSRSRADFRPRKGALVRQYEDLLRRLLTAWRKTLIHTLASRTVREHEPSDRWTGQFTVIVDKARKTVTCDGQLLDLDSDAFLLVQFLSGSPRTEIPPKAIRPQVNNPSKALTRIRNACKEIGLDYNRLITFKPRKFTRWEPVKKEQGRFVVPPA